MLKEQVASLLHRALEAYPSLFLIHCTLGSNNHIKIVLDGDTGVTLQHCMEISRAMEHTLNREEEDFSLEVTSAGATSPLQLPRQYKKNIGRKVNVKTHESAWEGTLTQASENGITLTWKAREPKPIGKGKVTVQKTQHISFAAIREAKVIIQF